MKYGPILLASCVWISVVSIANAQAKLLVIRYDANGRPQVQAAGETKANPDPGNASLSSTVQRVNSSGQPVLVQSSNTSTTQVSDRTRKSVSTTQIRDGEGKVRAQNQTEMTETKVDSNTTRIETAFKESNSPGGELMTTARMRETRRELSNGEAYQRVIEVRTSSGEFRPRQKVESQRVEYSSGASRMRVVESVIDLNGATRPTTEMTERQSAEYWGRQTVERIFRNFVDGGIPQLARVETEERRLSASTGILNERVIRQPDSLGLRETQRITTSVETPYGAAPYQMIVTKELPRNDRFGAPVVQQIELVRTVRRLDGTSYIERELRVRDVNGNLRRIGVTQTENTGNDTSAAEVALRALGFGGYLGR